MNLNRYFHLLRPLKFSIIFLVGLSLLTALLQLPIPLVFKYLMDTVFLRGTTVLLWAMIVLLLWMIGLGSLIGLCATIISIKIHQKFRSDLRQSLYAHVQRLPFDVYSTFMSGELTSRLIKDLDRLNLLLPSGIAGFIKNLTLSIGFIAVLFVLNWRMTLLLSITLPFFVLVFILSQKKMRSLSGTPLPPLLVIQTSH